MRTYNKYIVLAVAACMPSISSAATQVKDLKTLVTAIIELINTTIPLLFGIALVAFMWGVIRYLFSADPKRISEARSYIIFSIVAIAVMLSVWSIALLIKNSIFPDAPTPFSSQGQSQLFPQSSSELRLNPNGSILDSAPPSGQTFGPSQ